MGGAERGKIKWLLQMFDQGGTAGSQCCKGGSVKSWWGRYRFMRKYLINTIMNWCLS